MPIRKGMLPGISELPWDVMRTRDLSSAAYADQSNCC